MELFFMKVFTKYLMPWGHSQLLCFDNKVPFGGKYSSQKAGKNAYRGHLTKSHVLKHSREKAPWSLHLLIRASNPPEWLHSRPDPTIFQRPHLQISPQWGLWLQHMNLGETHIDHSNGPAMANYFMPLPSEGRWSFPAKDHILAGERRERGIVIG